MPKQTPLIRSFNAGEWSPLMSGRADLEKFSASCRKMLNFLPTPQGTAILRSGTAFVVPAAYSDTMSALLPFQFSTIQSCVLEFGNNILRFITNDGLVTSDGEIYTIYSPYAADDTNNIRYAQKNDVLYLFCQGYPVYKLERYGSTDWRLSEVEFTDGPWLDTNYAANHINFDSAGGTAKEGFTFTATGTPVGTETAAYDGTGTATWSTAQATTMTGYQVILPSNNSYTTDSTIYSQKDMEPVSWTLSGSNDGSTWVVIDTQNNFVDYQNGASDWIPVYPQAAYTQYKLYVSAVYTQGSIPPNVQTVAVTSDNDNPVGINFDNTTNINFGAGFGQGDVGRLIRVQRSDGVWVTLQILTVESMLKVTAKFQLVPLIDTTLTTYWRLGLYCETNGYPSCGVFFSERLWMGGVASYPDTIIGSEVGSYENMQPDDPRTADVSDSDAINVTIESRSQLLWMSSDDRGLVMGTAAGEWTLSSGGTSSVITPTSVVARNPTQRGSAEVDVTRIDHQIVYISRSGREARALSYSFEIDGYTSASLSVQASHLSQPAITRLAYAAAPYSNVWCVRSDGKLLSLTYMQDEQVSGWAQHDVGGVVESITVIPAPDAQQDTLWLSVKRTVNGQTVRFIERLLRTWDFDLTETDAAFVDSCTVDTSKSQSTTAFSHLAGEEVYGVIDGTIPFGPLSVGQNGSLDLPQAPQVQVIAGLGYEAELLTQRIEAGMQLGTAQGKIKRINQVVAHLWATGSGAAATGASLNKPSPEVTPIQFSEHYNCDTTEWPLCTFYYPFQLQGGYDRDGSLSFTKGLGDLFPLNIVSLTLSVEGEDGW